MKRVRGSVIGNRYQPHYQPSRATRSGVSHHNNRKQKNEQRNNWNGRARNEPNDTEEAAPDTKPPLRVLSFYEQGSRIAFAVYLEDTNEILFEDGLVNNGKDMEDIVSGVLLETCPNLILVGSKVVSNGPLLECLTRMPDLGNEERGQQNSNTEEGEINDVSSQASAAGTIPYQLLKSAAFEPRACHAVILERLKVLSLMRRSSENNLQMGYDPSNLSSYHALASVINFDLPALVRAIGSLLTFLQTTVFRLENGLTVTVNDVRRCNGSNSYLRLDDATLRALRIFATDFHVLKESNRGKSYSKSKEGFSIYTLLDRTKSSGGKERLRQWMMQPLRDVAKIRERHIAIELFLHPYSRVSTSLLLEHLGKIGNINAILLRIQRCCARPNDFLLLGRMLDAAHEIIEILSEDTREKAYQIDQEEGIGQLPSVAFVTQLIGRCHANELRNLRQRLASVINEEVTGEVKDHVVIHYGFHEELDRAKETFETLDGSSF